MIKAQGTHVCRDFLREKRANDALAELEQCLAVPVFRNESVQQCVPGVMSQYGNERPNQSEPGGNT